MNVSDVGETDTVVFAEIVSTTGMLTAPLGSVAPLVGLIVIDPVYTPTGNPLGTINTVIYSCVVPWEFPNESQLTGEFGVDAKAE